MREIAIKVDGRLCRAAEGTNLLDALVDAEVYVPHLCRIPGSSHPAPSCRLCFVEVEGRPHPVCACEISVEDGMSVHTGTSACRRLAVRALRLLAEEHRADCSHCTHAASCPFKELAQHLDVPFGQLLAAMRSEEQGVLDAESNPFGKAVPIIVDQGKCILCGRCNVICDETGNGFVARYGRGGDMRIVVDEAASDNAHICLDCGRCLDVCPVGALRLGE